MLSGWSISTQGTALTTLKPSSQGEKVGARSNRADSMMRDERLQHSDTNTWVHPWCVPSRALDLAVIAKIMKGSWMPCPQNWEIGSFPSLCWGRFTIPLCLKFHGGQSMVCTGVVPGTWLQSLCKKASSLGHNPNAGVLAHLLKSFQCALLVEVGSQVRDRATSMQWGLAS